jgi:hypothetical protein
MSVEPKTAADNASADLWTNGQLQTTFFAFLNPALDMPHARGEVHPPIVTYPACSARRAEVVWMKGFEGWPEQAVMSPEMVATVDRRWPEYGIALASA